MQKMEVSSGVLRLPLKNGVSPYNSTVNHHHSTQKHLRCSSNEVSTKRLPRKTANLMNKTMDNLNYWKRQFNQQEPGMASAGLPERLVRVGAVSRKAMMNSKEESHCHRPTNQSSALLITQKQIPKAFLKTLSPIQNSPKFLLSSCDCMSAKKSHHSQLVVAIENYSQAKEEQNELLDSLDETACLHSASQSSNDLRGKHCIMASDLENDPGKQQHKKLEYDDDDLVFAIEI